MGLPQGSALSTLLFIIVMEVVGREITGGLPWELLYADDLVLLAESEVDLKEKLKNWKVTMEAKGMKVNLAKTKLKRMGNGKDHMQIGKFPCAVCGKGVGSISILSGRCNK
jgi:Reverse transcriptase (RNA-dependent DNA polymerase)